jgi:enoyl-CoA hydratase/carnithine racemase
LSRVKDNISIGLFLGLTGHRLKSRELLKWGVATNYMESSKLPGLYEDVIGNTTKDSKYEEIKEIVDSHSEPLDEEDDIPETTINYCFQPNSIQDIVKRLTEVAEGKVEGCDQDLAKDWLKRIRRHSPISCGVVTEQILRGADMNLDDVFKMEYGISQAFMEHGEFYEGVRALLIDKCRTPKWKHSSIEDVTVEDVQFFFNRPEKLDLNLPTLYKDGIKL